jgi:hypothetical protein
MLTPHIGTPARDVSGIFNLLGATLGASAMTFGGN